MRLVAILALAATLAAVSAFGGEWTARCAVNDQFGIVRIGENSVAFDSALAPDASKFRYASLGWNRLFEGDFSVETDCEVARLDHWNTVRLSVVGAGWSASIARLQRKAGEHVFLAETKIGDARDRRELPSRETKFTLSLVRRGGELIAGFRMAGGAFVDVGRFPVPGNGGLRAAFGVDSAASTRLEMKLNDFRVEAAKVHPQAMAPTLGGEERFGPVTVLKGVNGRRNDDGSYTIDPGGRLLLMAEAPVSADGWKLRWKSAGRIRVRELTLGSAETIELSDNILWDDVGAAVPPGYAVRSCGFTQWVKRFNTDIGWPLSFVTTSGIFCFEVSPAGDEPIRFGEPEFFGRAVMAPEAFENLPRSTAPVTLSSGRSAVEFPVDAAAGAFEIVHVGGRQGDDARELLAGWLIVYADGTTAPAFATLRWNCGVFGENGYLPSGVTAAAPQGTPDQTWFGPPGFGWGEALYEPANEHGTHWNARYRWRLRNPHPERKVRAVQAFQFPHDNREYTITSFRVVPPPAAVLALVEPAEAVFASGDKIALNVWEWRAVPGAAKEEHELSMAKASTSVSLGLVQMRRAGRLGAAATTATPNDGRIGPGPVVFRCGAAESSRCSLMPAPSADAKPFYYTMICGGHDGIGDFDRMRRLGYDEAKVQIGWKLDENERPDFSGWHERIERAARAGLKVSVRNLFRVPAAFSNRMDRLYATSMADGSVKEVPFGRWGSPAPGFYREKLVDYYRSVAGMLAKEPAVKGLNANYGLRIGAFDYDGDAGTVKWDRGRIDGFGRWLGRAVTAAEIASDRSGELRRKYSRYCEELNDSLTREVCEAVRKAGYREHLAFNVNFHPLNHKIQGQSFAEYLRIGEKLGPASLFHETSERYSLSFVKWLAAARTFGQPYGDECCQPPPTYEQLMMAYLWMGMMQCFESNYCQWWGGRPAAQNIAQLKAYHRLMYDAEYLPDPVCLALSLETGHDEIDHTLAESKKNGGRHHPCMGHYGLASTLRELDVNADRYMIDAFPEKDANVKARLLIDDHTRSMPSAFADRIERFVRRGGTFLCNVDTDRLNDYAFFRRMGLDDPRALARSAASDDPAPFHEAAVGSGRVVVYLRSWACGWDPGLPEPRRRKLLATLERLGGFHVAVRTDSPVVSATPYLAKDGTRLVSLINISCVDRDAAVFLSKGAFGSSAPGVRDLGGGNRLVVADAGRDWKVIVPVGRINATMLRVR